MLIWQQIAGKTEVFVVIQREIEKRVIYSLRNRRIVKRHRA